METVGSLVDKLSINELKIYHMNEQIQRKDVDEKFLEDCNLRLSILKMQRDDLKEELQTLMDDVMSGKKKFKLYRQMKMYNDKKYKKTQSNFMKILITGASGLIGNNLVKHFGSTSHELLTPSHSELDLTDRAAVLNYLRKEKPDCVIHLAAKVGSIASNAKYPLQFLLENLDMSRNIIASAYEVGIKKFINIGSSCVYPAEKYSHPLTEDLAVTGSFEKENEGYSIAKASGVLMCKYIADENPGYLYKTLIPCNLYGGGCYKSFMPEKAHMIESAIKKIYTAKIENLPEVQIWGDGTAKRELIYADDLAKIIVYVAENLEKFPPVMNVGSGIEYTVNECYEIIAKILDYKGNFVHDCSKPSGTNRRLLDVSLMHKMGLNAETSLEDGIKATIEYYKSQIK